VDGFPNTFLEYVDNTFAKYTPDIFVEEWIPQAARKARRAFHTPHVSNNSDRPIDHFLYALKPCAVQGFVGKERVTASVEDLKQTGVYSCQFRNLRVHATDLRNITYAFADNDPGASRDATLESVIDDILRWPRPELLRVWEYFYSGFSPSAIFEGVVASHQSAAAFFTNPFLLAHSRTTHELMQLPPRIQHMLQQQATKHRGCYVQVPTLVYTKVLKWLSGKGPDCLKHAYCVGLYEVRANSYANHTSMDLYAIARALKVDRTGTRKRLCIFYFGATHCDRIAFYLSTLYTVFAWVSSEDKCLLLDGSSATMHAAAQQASAENAKRATMTLRAIEKRVSHLQSATRSVIIGLREDLQAEWDAEDAVGPGTSAASTIERELQRAEMQEKDLALQLQDVQHDIALYSAKLTEASHVL
jgi:hypothetical protein